MLLRRFRGDEFSQRRYVEMRVKEICQNIAQKGEKTHYEDIFQYLVEVVEDEECDV